MWYLKVVLTQIHKNQGTSLHGKCLVTSFDHIISQMNDIVQWICCKKWNKGKNGNTSKLTKSSNYLNKCNIFKKNIWKHVCIIACTVGLSFKTNWHKIHSITQHQARQQIPQTNVDFSKIRAILNRYGLILYQVHISRNQKKLISVWPHQVNKNSHIITCNHTTIICKTWTTILQTHKDLTTWVFVPLCIDWTQCNIQSKASVSTHDSYCPNTTKTFLKFIRLCLELRNKGKNVQIHNLWNHIQYSNYTINMTLSLKHL